MKRSVVSVSAFSEETIESLKDLGIVLLKIRHRLVTEGKVKVKNGKIVAIYQEFSE